MWREVWGTTYKRRLTVKSGQTVTVTAFIDLAVLPDSFLFSIGFDQ